MVRHFDSCLDATTGRPGSAGPQVGTKRKRPDEPHLSEKPHSDESSSESEGKDDTKVPASDDSRHNAQEQRNIRLRHFHILNAVLHRSLLEHDFDRASRAFGLLLRFDLGKRRIDVRRAGLWGIGAEILLKRGRQDAESEAGDDFDNDSSHDEHTTATTSESVDGGEDERPQLYSVSSKGFGDTRRYYDRLILQYPFQQRRPEAVSAWHFYPAMFSLWILQVQAESHRARTALARTRAGGAANVRSSGVEWWNRLKERSGQAVLSLGAEKTAGSELSAGNNNDHNDNFNITSDANAAGLEFSEHSAKESEDDSSISRSAIEEELLQATKIAASLAGLTASPPYDRHADLLELAARAARWVHDLSSAAGNDAAMPDIATAPPETSPSTLEAVAGRAFQVALRHGARLSEDEVVLAAHERVDSVEDG